MVVDADDIGVYSASGRGFPDIAAQAENFQIVVDGSTTAVDGTSCSAPVSPLPSSLSTHSRIAKPRAPSSQTVAGVISLLNDFLIAAGKAPLGFLNPLLYSTGAAGLNDITSGSNPGCSTSGFTAVSGWDPVRALLHIYLYIRARVRARSVAASVASRSSLCRSVSRFAFCPLCSARETENANAATKRESVRINLGNCRRD